MTWTATRYPIDLEVRPGSSDVKAAREVIDDNCYQRPRLGFTIDPACDRWLDAGANIGAFAALAGHLGALVVSVEPLEEHCRLAQANAPAAFVICGAVTPPGEHGPITINRYPPAVAWRSSAYRTHKAGLGVVLAEAYPIDELVAGFGVTAVKLDVEGAEMAILEGWVPPPSVTKIVWEWSMELDDDCARLRRVLHRFDALGYQTSAPSQVFKQDRWQHNGRLIFPAGVLCFAWS